METSKDSLTCGICKASFSFLSFAKFIEHKMLHVDANKQIYCCLCLKSFPKRSSLQIHMERVHAIPQRISGDASAENKDLVTANPSSARCKPCFLSNDNKVEIPQSSIDKSAGDVSQVSLVGTKEGICNFIQIDNETMENSNSSVDILSTDDPIHQFNENTLCHYGNHCVNGSLAPAQIQIENQIENNAKLVTESSNGIIEWKDSQKSNSIDTKQNPDFKDSMRVPLQSNGEMSVIHDQGNENREEKKTLDFVTSKSKSQVENNVDFHFFFGTTSIKGNSMIYDRVEFRCMHCSFSSAWRPSLVKHMKTAHSDVLPFHEILDIQNMTSQPQLGTELSKKYRIMKLSEHSRMTYINKSRAKSKRRIRSVEIQDVPGKYTCPVCDKVFSRVRYIRRHQMTHRTQRSYLCDNCGKSFKTKATLVAHSRCHNIKVYHCPQCDFVSNVTGEIHRHRQLHPNGSVVCDICGAAYIDKSTLKKHQQVHDLSRPFPCPNSNCTWRFKSDNLMKAHARAHNVEGKFLCSYCGYRFRHKHHLQRHITRIHPQNNLADNQATHPNPSSTSGVNAKASVSNVAMSSSISILPGNQEVSLDHEEKANGDLLDSQVILPFRNQISACEQTDLQERTELKSEQGVIKVLVHNGQEIIINLHPDCNLDLSNGDNINLEYNNTSMIQHVPLSQIYTIKDLPSS